MRKQANILPAVRQKWREAGYIVISMKNDFKTIYGENVKKTAFTF